MMKFAIALCLVLAVGCNAFFSTKDVDFQPFLRLQQKAMHSLISAHSDTDDPNLINNCFNQYIIDQTATLTNYNKVYTACVATAQTDKNTLTAQSEESRNDLLSRSEDMCSSMNSCESFADGLQFFDCYRTSSADSYKVMFTLNSDANTQYNTISNKYNIIDSDLTICVEDARLEYATGLEKCDSDFNTCISGGEVSTTNSPPVTTEKPVDSTTEEPVESTTEAPAVSTEEPVGSTTEAPAVSTEEPVGSTTEAPAVSTEEPVGSTTEAPAVSTEEPVESTTEAPAVSTEEPVESTTEAPAVSTEEPVESTTEAPAVSTEEPVESTTEAPASPNTEPTIPTEQPLNPTNTTPEKMPEEDIGKMLPETFRSALNKLPRFF
ncbi:GH20452 [Drosophila grimshawi]|uniref:GH20452 n=1 Tax=Drosophila grimshawi TaxID=7222 RepID=B4J9G2_DROGR|nr:GH20452 [Drosophila grimshawi]